MLEEEKEIKIIRYETLEALLSALWHVDEKDLKDCNFGGYDGDGNEYEFPYEEMAANIKEEGCYGFAGDKKDIHVWVGRNAEMHSVINLIAHEKAHLTRPFHRNEDKEEEKACKFGECAALAYKVAFDLLRGDQ